MSYKKIMVATDGSEASKNAVSKAIKLSECANAKLIVLSVADTSILDKSLLSTKHFGQEKELVEKLRALINSIYLREAEAVEKDVNKDKRMHKEKVKLIVETGRPADKILEVAKREKVDLLILGAHGWTGVRKYLLGSVSSEVSQKAEQDLIIIR